MSLTFNEAKHEYRLDGQVLPSVTQVIQAAGLIDKSWFDEYSRGRGVAVHMATAMLDGDELDEQSVDPAIVGYIAAWRKFVTESGFDASFIEARCCNLTCRYAGTIDRAGIMNGRQAVIDIKTGALNPVVGVQLAAYQAMYHQTFNTPGSPPAKTYAVQLKEDGSYSMREYLPRENWPVFLACLNIFNWKKNKGVK